MFIVTGRSIFEEKKTYVASRNNALCVLQTPTANFVYCGFLL